MGSYLRHNNIASQDFYFFNGDMINYLQEPEQLYRGFIDTARISFRQVLNHFIISGAIMRQGVMLPAT